MQIKTEYIKNISGIILLLFILFNSTACKKHRKCNDPTNPDCQNYDPCFGKREIKTDFWVGYPSGGFPMPPESCYPLSYDTLFGYEIRLEAPRGNPSNSKYTWQIGSDTTKYQMKTLELDFNDWLNGKENWGKSVTVKLKIETPYNGCMNIEDTLVEVSRNIFFTKDNKMQGAFYGKWEGSNTNDTFYSFKLVRGLSTFRGRQVNITGEIFFLNAPFADSFLTLSVINYYPSDPCEKRILNAYNFAFPEEGYVYAYQIERIYLGYNRYSFWVRKPGEAEKKYVFTGKWVYNL